MSKKQTEKGQSKSELTWKGGFSCGGRQVDSKVLLSYCINIEIRLLGGFCFFLRNLK